MVTLLGPLTYPSPGLYPVALGSDSSTGNSGSSPSGGGDGDGVADPTYGAYAPSLIGYSDFNPLPRVRILFTGFEARTATVNVYRQARGRQMPVAGGINLPVSGGVGLVDIEAPYGIPCLYLAQQFDSDGVFISNTGTAQITLDCDVTTIHNPFDPQGGVRVRVGADTGKQVTSGGSMSTFYPTGRRAGIAVTGQRYGIPAAPVFVWTDSTDTADQLDEMFGPVSGELGLPPFLCIRFAGQLQSRIRLPQPLFLAVPNPVQTPVNLLGGGQKIGWDLSGPEVDRPAAALTQALYTRDDMDAAFLSRAARDAAYTSRLAMDSDFNHSTGGSVDSGSGATRPYGAGSYGTGTYGT